MFGLLRSRQVVFGSPKLNIIQSIKWFPFINWHIIRTILRVYVTF